jgi:SWIM zinc finger
VLNFHLDYASPSAFEAQRERALLGLSADHSRKVRFKGKMRRDSVFLIRTVLRALGEVIWSDEHWHRQGFYDILDPIITVHSDKVLMEAFSQDQSVHALATFDRTLFETDGPVVCGTSNVDFTAWLWGALGEMRTSRTTWLQIDHAGLELSTVGAGGRFERKVEVPESWVRGFLQLQAAAGLPGTRLQVKPVDLLSVIRFLRYSKAKTSPRALRYEFEPGDPVRVVLEPWEEVFVLRDTTHNYDSPKKTRLWGRRRLRLLEPLLPFTDRAEVFLKGRGLPSFYHLHLPGMEFTLSLSGWSANPWSDQDGFHLLANSVPLSESDLKTAQQNLTEKTLLKTQELSQDLGVEPNVAESLLTELCRRGCAFYQPSTRQFRHRELFSKPIDLKKIYPPNSRQEAAQELISKDLVEVRSCHPRETRKIKKLASPQGKVLRTVIHRDWCMEGRVDQHEVEIVLNDRDRVIFGKCGCPHFQENLMGKGPCEHMLALRTVGSQHRVDLPTSSEAQDVSEEELE